MWTEFSNALSDRVESQQERREISSGPGTPATTVLPPLSDRPPAPEEDGEAGRKGLLQRCNFDKRRSDFRLE